MLERYIELVFLFFLVFLTIFILELKLSHYFLEIAEMVEFRWNITSIELECYKDTGNVLRINSSVNKPFILLDLTKGERLPENKSQYCIGLPVLINNSNYGMLYRC